MSKSRRLLGGNYQCLQLFSDGLSSKRPYDRFARLWRVPQSPDNEMRG